MTEPPEAPPNQERPGSGNRRYEYQALLAEVATRLVDTSIAEMESGIAWALETFCDFLGADRACRFDYDFAQGQVHFRRHWSRCQGLSPKLLEALPLACFHAWLEAHGRGDGVFISCLKDLPPSPLRSALLSQRVSALITLPLMREGRCFGFLGFDVLDNGCPFYSDDPAMLAGFARLLVALDKRLEDDQAYRRSRDRFGALWQAIRDAAWVVDLDGYIQQVNQAASRLSGYSPSELQGSHVTRLEVDHDETKVQEVSAAVKHAGSALFESRHRCADGRVIDVQVSLSHVPSEAVNVAIVRDITERKAAEMRTRELLERLHKLTNRVPGFLYQFQQWSDGRAAIPYASEGILATHGVSAQEVAADASPVFACIHPEDLDRIQRSILRSASRLEVWHERYRVELEAGRWHWLEGQAQPERQADGSTLWHGYIRDITDLKEQQAREAQLQDALQQRDRLDSLGKLTGGIAHDFNHSLGLVLGYVEMALLDLPAQHQALEPLRQAMAAGSQASGLIEELLVFARGGQSDHVMLSPGPEIQQCLHLLEGQLPSAIRLEFEDQGVTGCLFMDHHQLHQVVINLVMNARDAIGNAGCIGVELAECQDVPAIETPEPGSVSRMFMPQNTGGADQASDQDRRGWICLRVTDTGMGMDPGICEKIFDPLFTTRSEGSGMGLAVVHGILARASGRVQVRSRPGAGTVFDIYLPRYSSASLEAQPTLPRPRTARVLVVDDSPREAEAVAAALEAQGHEVRVAGDALDALAAFKADSGFDLLLTDQQMPDLSGTELIDTLRRSKPALPAILHASFTELEVSQLEAESIWVLYKPLDAAALESILARALSAYDST